MFDIDSTLSLIVSCLLLYDTGSSLSSLPSRENDWIVCIDPVSTVRSAAPDAFQVMVSRCKVWTVDLIATPELGLWMAIIFFALLITSVVSLLAFRLASTRGARRAILDLLRGFTGLLLSISFFVGVQASALLFVHLRARWNTEDLSPQLARSTMQAMVTAAAVLEPILLGIDFVRRSRKAVLDAEGGVRLSDAKQHNQDEKAVISAIAVQAGI